MKKFLSIFLLLVAFLPGISAEARDRGRGSDDPGRSSRSESYDFKSDYLPRQKEMEDSSRKERSGRRLSRDDAARIAEKNFEGRILGVKEHKGVWRVKMLNRKGEVRIVSVDDETGEVIPPR